MYLWNGTAILLASRQFLLSKILYAIPLKNIKFDSHFSGFLAFVENLLDFACCGVIKGRELARERDSQGSLGLGETGNVNLKDGCGI